MAVPRFDRVETPRLVLRRLRAEDLDALVGDCALRVDESDARLGEIGFTLSRRHQGQGLGTEAVRALLGYGFGTLGLHRVIGVTDAKNGAAAAVLERLGMRREAHFVENGFFKGAWGDGYQYALLGREWAHRS